MARGQLLFICIAVSGLVLQGFVNGQSTTDNQDCDATVYGKFRFLLNGYFSNCVLGRIL